MALNYPYELINVEKKYELPNELVGEHNQYVKYKLTDFNILTDEQKTDMTRLTQLLYPYNICASDWNKFQEITANLQKFLSIDFPAYINSIYFSWDDVCNEIDDKIENYVNIFKTGEMIQIMKEALKRWGGGDFMGKTMIPIDISIANGSSYTYTNNNGGILRCDMISSTKPYITLIVDGNIIIDNKGISSGSINGREYIISFNNTFTIINNGNVKEDTFTLRGMYYINCEDI